MIDNIHIKNFKSLEDVSLSLSNLNVITGINGMGKSSLLQVLLLLRQSNANINSSVKLNGDLTGDLGEYKDVIYRNASDDSISFSISSEKKPYSWDFYHDKELPDILSRKIDVQKIKNGLALFNEKKCQYISAGRVTPDSAFRKSSLELVNKQFGKDGVFAVQYLYERGNEVDALFTEVFDEHTKKPLPLISQVDYWLSQITTNVKLDIRPKSSREYELRYRFNEKDTSVSYSAINSAFGLTFALPIITALLAAEKGDLLILENPESDLHPQAQSLLGQLMARAAAAGVQIIVETHSDHILNGICVAIHQKKISNELTKVYYFHKNQGEQHTNVYEVPIQENGQRLTRNLRLSGINGFFDQANNDLDIILGFNKRNQ